MNSCVAYESIHLTDIFAAFSTAYVADDQSGDRRPDPVYVSLSDLPFNFVSLFPHSHIGPQVEHHRAELLEVE